MILTCLHLRHVYTVSNTPLNIVVGSLCSQESPVQKISKTKAGVLTTFSRIYTILNVNEKSNQFKLIKYTIFVY